MGYLSTGARNKMVGQKAARDIFKDFKMWLYSGAIPANADAAETGTRICPITVSGATVKVKQKITITPVIGDAAGDVWSVTLNGVTAKFTDDGSATVAEVCTGLANALNVLNGTAITTPACDLSIPDTEGLFTITDNTTNVTVEAATAGVSFEYSSTVTGATTASLTSVLTTDNAYGFRWEPYSDVADATLESLSTDTWRGTFLSDAVITHARIQADDDTGVLSTSAVRLQLSVGLTSNSEVVVSHVDGVTGETVTASLAELYMDAS